MKNNRIKWSNLRSQGREKPIINRRGVIFFSVILLLVLPLLSCGKKTIKPPQDVATAKDSFALIEELKTAYIEKNRTKLEALSTNKGYISLIGAIKEFNSAELEFSPTWVEIEGDRVDLQLSWEGTWRVTSSEGADASFQEKGLAIFILRGSPLRLDEILRDNPFRQPE